MSSKKESALQAFAAVLGILASVVALHDWYGKRNAAAEPGNVSASAAVGIFPLTHSRADKPAPEPAAAAPAPEPAASPPPAPAPAVTQPLAASPAPVPAPSPPPTRAPASAAGAPRPADPFMAMVNPSADARDGVAAVVRGAGAGRLLNGLEERGVQVVRDVFRGGFAQSAYFEQMLGGDGSALRRSGALRSGRVLVGDLEHTCRPAEELVVCDMTFSYVVLDARGPRLAQRDICFTATVEDDGSPLNAAIDAMLAKHGATIARAAGG